MEKFELIFGKHPVLSALRKQQPANKLYIATRLEDEGALQEVYHLAKLQKIVIQRVDRRRLDEMTRKQNHQGFVLAVAPKSYATVESILEIAKKRKEPPFVLVLDGIEDPHNLGALIRSAEVAGMHGVIIPEHRAVGLTGIVAKSSAGAVEYLPVAKVTNITRTLEELKEAGVWVAGLEVSGNKYYYEQDLKGPMALVIGSEGKGISRLVQEHCDFLVKIPMMGKTTSLNASVAGGILIFEALKQRTAVK